MATLLLVVVSACSDDENAPPVDATWTPGLDIPQQFRDFAPEIDRALERQDIQFFADRAPGGDLNVGHAFSDTGETLPANEWLELIQSLWLRAVPGEQDSFGEAQPRVFAFGRLASPDSETQTQLGVLVSAIIERPPDMGGSGPLRVVVGIHWRPIDGGWQVSSLLQAFVNGEALLQDDGGWFNPREDYQR